MFCNRCGQPTPDKSRFCLKCGNPLSDFVGYQGESRPYNSKTKQAASNWPLYTIAAITSVILVMAVIAVIGVANMILSNRKKTTTITTIRSGIPDDLLSSRPVPPPPPPSFLQPTPYWKFEHKQVCEAAFSLQAGQYKWFTITINPAWRNARLHGRFEAAGGSGNDVQVAIVDDDGLLNFRNNHQFRSYYNSGKVTADTLEVRLPPGTYHIIYSNAMALLSGKAVTTDMKLEYEVLFNANQ